MNMFRDKANTTFMSRVAIAIWLGVYICLLREFINHHFFRFGGRAASPPPQRQLVSISWMHCGPTQGHVPVLVPLPCLPGGVAHTPKGRLSPEELHSAHLHGSLDDFC